MIRKAIGGPGGEVLKHIDSFFATAVLSAKAMFKSDERLDPMIYIHALDDDGQRLVYVMEGWVDEDIREIARKRIKEMICDFMTRDRLEGVALMAEAWTLPENKYRPAQKKSISQYADKQEVAVVITWLGDGQSRGGSFPIQRTNGKAVLKAMTSITPNSLRSWIDDAFKAASLIKAASDNSENNPHG